MHTAFRNLKPYHSVSANSERRANSAAVGLITPKRMGTRQFHSGPTPETAWASPDPNGGISRRGPLFKCVVAMPSGDDPPILNFMKPRAPATTRMRRLR